MELRLSLANLQSALQFVVPVVPSRSTIPVLENVLIEGKEGKLLLTTTDQEIMMTAEIPVETDGIGKVLLPAKKFFEVVRSFGNEGMLTIRYQEDSNHIEVDSPTGEYYFNGLNPEDFPLLTPEQNQVGITFHDGIVPMIAKKTTFAVSKDEYRLAMTGVLFEFLKDQMNAVATDGYRLVRVQLKEGEEYAGDVEERSIIIPARALDLVRKADGEVRLSIDTAFATFEFENIRLTTRLIQESYPAYRSVIPEKAEKIVHFKLGDALAAVRRASLFVSAVAKHLKFVFDDKGWSIIGEDAETGQKAIEHVPADYRGEPFEIGFNYRFIEEALVHLADSPETEVEMGLIGETRPAVLHALQDGEVDPSILMLVMPVRL